MEAQERYGPFCVSNNVGGRNGLKGLCNSNSPGLDTCCVHLGNSAPSTLLVTQMRANRRGKRKAGIEETEE